MSERLDTSERKSGVDDTSDLMWVAPESVAEGGKMSRIRIIVRALAMIALGTSGVCGTACPGEARAESDQEDIYYGLGDHEMEDFLGRVAIKGEVPGNAMEALKELLDVDWDDFENSPCEAFDNCVEPAEDIFERLVRLAVEEDPEGALRLLREMKERRHPVVKLEHINLAQGKVNQIMREQADEKREELERQELEIERRQRELEKGRQSPGE